MKLGNILGLLIVVSISGFFTWTIIPTFTEALSSSKSIGITIMLWEIASLWIIGAVSSWYWTVKFAPTSVNENNNGGK